MRKFLFRILTEHNIDHRDTRRSVKLEEVAKLANVSYEQVAAVVEIFRDEGRNFLTPPDKALEPNTVIDISHETLIRQWQRLKKWTKEEIKSATIYQRLEDTACLWNKEKWALLRTPELEYTLAWRDREKPTEQWSKRYGEHFGLAMDFLQESQNEQKREQAQAKQQRELQQEKRWQQLITNIRLIFMTVAFGLVGVAGWQWQIAEEKTQKLKLSVDAFYLQKAGAEAYYSKDYSTALKKWKTGLKQAREINDKSYEAKFLSYIGIVYQALNQNQQALDYYKKALKIQREIGDKRGIGNNLTNIGMVYQNLGQYQKAFYYYKKAVVIKREIGELSGEDTDLILNNIKHSSQANNYPKALEYFQQVLKINPEIGDEQTKTLSTK